MGGKEDEAVQISLGSTIKGASPSSGWISVRYPTGNILANWSAFSSDSLWRWLLYICIQYNTKKDVCSDLQGRNVLTWAAHGDFVIMPTCAWQSASDGGGWASCCLVALSYKHNVDLHAWHRPTRMALLSHMTSSYISYQAKCPGPGAIVSAMIFCPLTVTMLLHACGVITWGQEDTPLPSKRTQLPSILPAQTPTRWLLLCAYSQTPQVDLSSSYQFAGTTQHRLRTILCVAWWLIIFHSSSDSRLPYEQNWVETKL